MSVMKLSFLKLTITKIPDPCECRQKKGLPCIYGSELFSSSLGLSTRSCKIEMLCTFVISVREKKEETLGFFLSTAWNVEVPPLMSPVSSSLESQLWQTDSTLVSHEPSSSKADTKPEIIMAYQHSMQFGSDSTISPALKGRIAMFERSGKLKIIINFFCGFAWKWLIQAINTTQYTRKL